jgi:O-6-methylguanine DNA methyltransferase
MYYASTQSPVGKIHLIATQTSLVALYFETQVEKMKAIFDSNTLHRDRQNLWLMRTEAFLACYFAGDLNYTPDVNLTLTGTILQRKVWKALTMVQPGETRTYAQIAEAIDRPKAVRAVATAIGHNPISILIPCHRVVGSSNRLAGYSGGLGIKHFLLAHELRLINER